MAVVQELDKSFFMDRFRDMGRQDQFSYEAKSALFDYLEELSEDLGEDIKLDVIGLCCDWYESTMEEIIDTYSIDVSEAENEKEKKEQVLDFINNNTQALDLGKTILYQVF